MLIKHKCKHVLSCFRIELSCSHFHIDVVCVSVDYCISYNKKNWMPSSQENLGES